MKFYYFFLFSLLLPQFIFSQTISRGPEPGELYFTGFRHYGQGLYYSTDYGQTAICMDSIHDIWSISADRTPGGVYYFTYPESLYYSDNYGNHDSWVFRSSDITSRIVSGIIPGHISSMATRHSEDYGNDFYHTSCNGCFGSGETAEYDNINDNIGYLLVTKVTVGDTIYLLKSFDKFENAELIHKFNYEWWEHLNLARGNDSGEVFMYNYTRNQLWFTNDYFESLQFVDTFNIVDFGIVGIEGDNENGVLYFLYAYQDTYGYIRHNYILHSQDYGVTFDVYHPFAKGNQPLLANFSAINKTPQATTPIEFDNFSIGDVEEYQWDFENDGIIDSYDEYPVHIYQDTGYYSVNLTIVGADSSNSFTKENYIHVIDTVSSVATPEVQPKISLFPNPFTNKLTIQFSEDIPDEINILRC